MAGHRGYYMAALCPMSRSVPSFFHQSVYLSAIHFLHNDYGFLDPLSNCLQLQRLLQEIKQHQDSSSPQHQQVIADLMSLLHHRSLDLTTPDNWAGCCVGLLRASESTVNLLHLTLADEQVNSPLNPQSVNNYLVIVPIQILSGRAASPSLAAAPSLSVQCFPWLITFIFITSALFFSSRVATPFLEPRYLVFYKLPYCRQVSMEMFLIIALEWELQLLLLVLEFQTISLKPRATGQAKHILFTVCMFSGGHNPFSCWKACLAGTCTVLIYSFV